jgi:hypothetical protein
MFVNQKGVFLLPHHLKICLLSPAAYNHCRSYEARTMGHILESCHDMAHVPRGIFLRILVGPLAHTLKTSLSSITSFQRQFPKNVLVVTDLGTSSYS